MALASRPQCKPERLHGICLVPSFPKVRIYFSTVYRHYSLATNIQWFILHQYDQYWVFQIIGLRFPSSYVSQRLLAAAWCLIAFVFVNVYCSTLTSYMSVTYQRPTINSVRDLAFTPSYKATVIAGSIQDIDLQVKIFYLSASRNTMMYCVVVLFYTFTLQRSRNEILKIIAERVEKCSADCKKFNLIDLATTVLEKDNYVSILVSSKSLFVKKFFFIRIIHSTIRKR